MIINYINNHFRELYSENKEFNIYLKILSFLSVCIFVSVIILNEYYVLGIASILVLASIYFILVKPQNWIYLLVLYFPLFAQSRDEDIQAEEIIALGIYGVILFAWLFVHLFIKRKKIVYNLADWLILFLLFVMLGNFIIAVLNGVSIYSWAREYLMMFLILLYFPIREYIDTRKKLKTLLILFSVSTLINAVLQIKTYYDLMSSDEIQYAYQLLTGIRTNQFYFTSAALIGLFYFFVQKNILSGIYIAGVTILAFTAMFISLSRTYWVFFAFGVLMYFIYLPSKKKILFIQFSVMLIAILTAVIFTFWKENANIYLEGLEKRITSSTKGKKDVSLLMRYVEYKKAFQHIKEHPIGGNSLSKKFTFYSPFTTLSNHTTNIHNGYLSLWFRAGIFIMITYFIFYIIYTIKILDVMPKARDSLLKPLALGTLATFLLFFASNITSAQFIYKETVFTMGFAIAFVSIIENILKKDKLWQ